MFRKHIPRPITFHRSDVRDYYTIGKKLGSGTYGKVYIATRQSDGTLFALKRIAKRNPFQNETKIHDAILFEIDLLNHLMHPNIVNLVDFYSSRRTYDIVTDLCEGGELFDAITDDSMPVTRADIQSIANDMLSALRYCHEQQVVHRDVKPENIMLVHRRREGADFPSVKLIDFGLSTRFAKGVPLRERVGTEDYMAPEVFYRQFYDETCDIYSLGCVLYACLCGCMIERDDAIYSRGTYRGQDNHIYGEEFEGLDTEKIFLNGLLDSDPKYRWSASDALQNGYFDDIVTNAPLPSAESIVKKLKRLNNEDKLRRVVKNIIGRHLLPSDKRKLERLFGHRLTMTIAEAARHIGNKFGDVSQDQLESISKDLDLNDDGVIDRNEFISTIMPEYLYDTRKRIFEAFAEMDRDRNKGLSFNEVVEALFGDVSEASNIWKKLHLGKNVFMSASKYELYLKMEFSHTSAQSVSGEQKSNGEMREEDQQGVAEEAEDGEDDEVQDDPWQGAVDCSVQ